MEPSSPPPSAQQWVHTFCEGEDTFCLTVWLLVKQGNILGPQPRPGKCFLKASVKITIFTEPCMQGGILEPSKSKDKNKLQTNVDLGLPPASSPGFPSCEFHSGEVHLVSFPRGQILVGGRWPHLAGLPNPWPLLVGGASSSACLPLLRGLVGSVMLDCESGSATWWPSDPANLLVCEPEHPHQWHGANCHLITCDSCWEHLSEI